jgi:adenylate cyclase
VAHVLEGSVRKAGNQVRITAQLIDARTDTHLWSETYDRTLDDVFAIQDEIAAAVVAELKVKLLADAPRSTRTDPQAFAIALQARRLLDEWGDPQRTYDLLQQAIQLDPNYVPAWTGFARLYWRLAFFDDVRNAVPAFRQRTPEEIHQLRREAIDRALAIDPQNAGALAFRAGDLALRDRQAAAREFEQALTLDPNDQDVLRPAAVFAAAIGRFDAAVDLLRHAVDRDPLCQSCWYNLARHSRSAGRLTRRSRRSVSTRASVGMADTAPASYSS